MRGRRWDRLLSAVPITQHGKKKDARQAGQSASDEENAVAMNEAVRGAQTFDLCARKPLQDLFQAEAFGQKSVAADSDASHCVRCRVPPIIA